MNWWLVVTAVIGCLLTFGLSAYVVFVLTTPSELKTAIFPKCIAVLGLALACFAVLLLPYETGNRIDPTSVEQYGGGIDTVLMWQIVLWTAGALIIVVIPFSMFFYEAHDPEQYSFVQQCVPAVLYTFGLLVIFLVIFLALYFTIGVAVLPYYAYQGIPSRFDPFNDELAYVFDKTTATLELQVSAFVYLVGLLCAIGWFLFIIYGGVGLVALPVGLLRYLYTIPKRPLSDLEYAAEQERIAAEALGLINEAKQLQKQSTSDFRVQRKVNAFNAKVQELEDDLARIEDAHESKELVYLKIAALFGLTLLCFGLLIAWVLHIFIHNIVQLNGFLNVVLVTFDDAFPLLGLLAYGLLVFFLLWCVVVGNIKVGLRFTFFAIHPLRYRDTRINSILFNVGLILTTSIAVVQFCTHSFQDYAANTAADSLFAVYVRRLKGFGPMFPWLVIALLAVFLVSATWVILCPRPKKKDKKKKDDDDD